MNPAATALRSFRDVPGWREAFRESAQRLDEVRTGSLFALPETVCGEPVRALTLADWTVLDQADNPFVAGGVRTVAHAVNLLWLLSPNFRYNGRWAKFRRGLMAHRVMRRMGCNEAAILDAVDRFVDDAFLDAPGRFSGPGGAKVPDAPNWPRKALEVELCAEIMTQFPAFTFEGLRRMPLALFWQWLHEARAKRNPEYRNRQITDEVNARANSEFNRLRREAAKSEATATTKNGQ
jgi:hypothetical protein